MKPLLLMMLLTGIAGFATAQFATKSGPNTTAVMHPSPLIFLTDIQGKRLTEEWNRQGVKGSPFIVENWARANVTMKNNRSYDVLLKINCVNNMVHYLDASQTEMAAPPIQIVSIKLTDTAAEVRREYDFVTGYPPIEKNNEATLYEKQVDGKAQLLQLTKKRLMETKTMGSAAPDREFMTFENWYIFKDGKIYAWKKNKEALLEILSDKKEAIAAYVQEQKLKCKTPGDLRQILVYYNELP